VTKDKKTENPIDEALKPQKVPDPKLIDVMREIKTMQNELNVAIEAVKALGKDVIDSNQQTQGALTDLAVKMSDLQGAFIRTVSEKQLPTVLSQPTAKRQPTEGNSQFDPADLMNHKGWKNRKQGEGNYTKGSIEWGWDFKDQFKPETLAALPIEIQGYSFSLNGNIVTAQKPRGS
jgi:hypothetical protein